MKRGEKEHNPGEPESKSISLKQTKSVQDSAQVCRLKKSNPIQIQPIASNSTDRIKHEWHSPLKNVFKPVMEA